jgi:CHAT domain-containing protein/uncharacterized protein HemY
MLARKIFLTLPFAILVTASTPLVFPSLFNVSRVLAQTTNERKAEADRLLEQGIEQLQTGQFEAALQSWQQALKIYREIKDRQGEGAALGSVGVAYRNLGYYPQAIDYFKKSLAIAREINDRKAEGDSLGNLGIAYNAMGYYPQAIDYYKQSLAIAREINDRKAEGSILSNLGIAYLDLGYYPQAIDCFKESLAIAGEINDRKSEGASLTNLGIAHNAMGYYPQAIDYYKQSLAIAGEINDRQGEGNALDNLGLAYYSLGDYAQAVEYHEKSLAIAREINDRQGEGASLGNLGNAYKELGDYTQAIEYHEKSLAIAQEIKDRKGEGQSLGNLGNAYLSLGDYAKAIKYYKQSLAIAQEIKDRQSEGQSLNYLGLPYYFLEDYPQAIKYYKQSLGIAREIKDRQGEGRILGHLGNAYNALGDYKQAIEYHKQDLAIAREIKDRQGEGYALGNLGNAYQNLSDYAQAIEYHQQNLAIVREIKDRQGEGNALNNLGSALRESGNLAEAEKTLRAGIEAWKSLRGRLGNKDEFKISIFEQQSRTYRLLQTVLVARNKTNDALEIAEQGRARAFVDLLATSLSFNSKNDLTQTPTLNSKPTLATLQQIAKQHNATLVQYSIIYDEFKIQDKKQSRDSELYIWVIKPTGEITFHSKDLKPLWQQQNISLRDKVAQARQSIVKGVNVASRGNKITLTPGDRVRLKDDLSEWDAWEVISVNPQNQTITVWLPSGGTGTKSDRPMTDVVEKVTNSASANTKNSQLQELYQLLIQPIADLLPKEEAGRVIFIPQDALFLVPFPALQDPSGKYLIDKHTILTAPSIEVLDSTHKLRQKVPGSAKDILVVGNPTMPKVSKMLGEPPQQLSALPSSEKEALAIASFWKTQALIGNQAIKNTVLQKLPKAKIIHLATHGILDDIQGLGSSIVFAPEGEDNGLLTAKDILNLYAQPQGSALSAELVVLSACDTGQGRLTGDGIIGLSRSIIAAGVPSVIVSLWSIPDAPTAELMTEFYEKFRKNPDKAAALRQAMLTTKKKHPNPADWAAFTLIGESE